MRTSQHSLDTVSTIGIDVGKNTFRLVGFDKRRDCSAAEGHPSSAHIGRLRLWQRRSSLAMGGCG